jgi:hypothetical protein
MNELFTREHKKTMQRQVISQNVAKAFTDIKDNQKINSKERLYSMKNEIKQIKAIKHDLQEMVKTNSDQSLPILILLSNYISDTITYLEQQYDHDITIIDTLTKSYQQLKDVIIKKLPPEYLFNIPYILIDADYNSNT